jgi:hypothetical protein
VTEAEIPVGKSSYPIDKYKETVEWDREQDEACCSQFDLIAVPILQYANNPLFFSSRPRYSSLFEGLDTHTVMKTGVVANSELPLKNLYQARPASRVTASLKPWVQKSLRSATEVF